MRSFALVAALSALVGSSAVAAVPDGGDRSQSAHAAMAMGFDQDRTAHHFYLYEDGGAIDVAVKDGDVTLSGRVESRAVKHLAETMVETVFGVKEVHNQLRVGAVAAESAWRREEDVQSGGRSREAPKNRRR